MPNDGLLVAHRGVLVELDSAGNRLNTYHVSRSPFVRVVEGTDGFFAVKHHEFAEPPVRTISAHRVENPAQAVAQLEIGDDWTVSATGDPDAWSHLPHVFNLVYPYALQLKDDVARITRLPGLKGSSDDPEDPYRMIACPGGESAIVTFNHGGRFIVVDLADGSIIAERELGFGPPTFRFRPSTEEAWLAHTDTLFRIDTTSWDVIDALRIRSTMSGREISDLHFDTTGQRCVVAYSERRPVPLLQPYRLSPVPGKVLVFDVESFRPISGADTERWVDEVMFLDDGRVAVRERSADLNVAVLEVAPIDFPVYPPREPGEEWR